MIKEKVWLYSGTFDPFTIGHLDIVERAAKRCDKLIIAVFDPIKKNTVFTTKERINMILLAIAHCDNIEVVSFQGRIADLYTKLSADIIVRGLRNASDLCYEAPMAQINNQLNRNLETIFLLCRSELSHVSSTNVRELGSLGDNLLGMVPKCNLKSVQNRFAELRKL